LALRNRDGGGVLPINPEADTAGDSHAGKDVAGGVSLTKRIAAISRWRENYNPLRQLNLPRAVSLLENYTRGWYGDLQWTYFFIEQTDADLFALCDRRTSRLLEMDCVAVAQKEADKTLAEEQAAMIEERIGKIDNLYDAIEHLEMAVFRGFSHLEKWYGADGELNHLEIVDQWNVVRDGLRGGWRYNPRAWQTAYWGLGAEMDLDPANFVIREVRRHIDRLGLLKFMSANLAQKDWDAFLEIYGIPSGVVTGPQNVTNEIKAEFEAAAEQIAEGGAGYLPYGSIYTKNDMPRGGAPFKERLDYLTEKLILAGTGGLLTMVARSGSGTLAGGAHADVFEQLAKADARKISDILNRNLVDGWLAEKFPGQPKAARFSLAANEETKTGEIVAHIKDLYAAGLQVDEQEASERTGYKLTRITPAAPAGGLQGNGGVDGRNADPNTGDPASIANRRIANARRRAMAPANNALFRASALDALSAAQAKAFRPLIERGVQVLTASDGDFDAALAKLQADLPAIQHQILSQDTTGELAKVWESILGPALVSGAVEGAVVRRPAIANRNDNHDGRGLFASAAGDGESSGGAGRAEGQPGEAHRVEIADEHWTGTPKEMHARAEAIMRTFQPVTNEATGKNVSFTRDGRDKTLYTLRTPHEFQAAARALPEMVRTGQPTSESGDRKTRQDVGGFTKLASGVRIGDAAYRAEITLKSANQGTGGAIIHKFYLLRLQK
jgi:phage gp29-like protein